MGFQMNGRLVLSVLIMSLVLSAAAVCADDASYTIHEGETLFAIAQKTGVPLDVLCRYNGIQDAGRVRAGTRILLPRSHEVKKGDTLYSISRKYSVTLQELLALNSLREDSVIKAGEKMFIPGPNPGGQAVASAGSQASGGAGMVSSGGTPGAPSSTGAASTGPAPKADLVWPHPGKREQYWGKIPGLVFHGAVGDRVVSVGSGEVVWVAPYWGYGKVVIIENFDDGLMFTYAGNDELLVNVGDRVKPGSEIARLGQSPKDGDARLYFSICTRSGQVVNPEKYFSKS